MTNGTTAADMIFDIPTRLVLDTNVVLDMLHFADHRARPLQTAIESGRVRCFSDAECLAELARVSAYPEFKLDAEARAALLDRYRKLVKLCEATAAENYALPRCRDTDDQKFLVLSARCRAELLVTRDNLLLELERHRNKMAHCAIVTAQRACQLLELD